ncbi:MAG: response regulator transcription factor [Bacteroidales bacterium]|nr:response regulator transcription factor [Bacteroidales bacterium]MDD5815720.1 response regulator transcription factor [Bacteroidales bacterium]MDY4520297.1 response regulator transcription factor [Bacteroidales bacterium]
MVKIGVYDSHPLLRSALTKLVDEANEDFEAEEVDIDVSLAVGSIKRDGINIVLVTLHHGEEAPLEFVSELTKRFERVRCIVMLMEADPKAVTHAIRVGTKGIVAPQTEIGELVQAILTVRNGFEFFSKSVTDMLVNKYVDGVVATEDKATKNEPDIDLLSRRQIEILKLWGNNMSNKDIADKLYLSVRTVESHKNHIMQKLNLKTTVDIIRFGIRNNIIDL